MSRPLLFASTQSGAPALSGQSGKLLDVLNSCLVVNTVLSAVSGGSFLDRTTEARLNAGTAFTPFQTPGTSDEFYVGMSQQFDRMWIDFATPGAGGGGTIVYEYWNGSSWTTLTTTDGTSGFTADGKVTWSIPADWVTTAVNSVTQYWIRVRLTDDFATNPTINYLTVTGFIQMFTGTNKAVYRSVVGNQLYFRCQDDSPGAGTGKEARVTGYESMSDVDTGTGPFPTAAQGPGSIAMLVARKSTTADGTARTWKVLADDRTFYVFVLTGDAANTYFEFGFGEFYSLVTGDSYRTILMGRTTENSTGSNVGGFTACGSNNAAASGNYVPRSYTGVGTSLNVGKHMDAGKNSGTQGFKGTVPWPNPEDGGLYISPVWIHESATLSIRGRLRGIMVPLHVNTSFSDGDSFSLTGALAGKVVQVLRILVDTASSSVHCLLETSDTWETNV